MKRPRFSIVIPTRNRADLLMGAVRSALRQTYGDLEVVVSDNCSTDATAEVAATLGDARARYVRSADSMLMHDSWRFALRHARGEYVGFLCDDDALHPMALQLADQTIRDTRAEVIAWRSCSYCLPDWPDAAARGRVRFGPPYGDRMFALDGALLLDLAYDLRLTFSELVPKMLNCVVSRRAIARADADGAGVFYPSSPDYSAMLVLAAHARGIVLLDVPLLVTGATARSTGASTLTGYEGSRAYGAELIAQELDLVRPPAVGPRITWLAQTYMECTRRVAALRDRSVNAVHLHGLARMELDRARREGIEARDFWTEHEAALRGELAHLAQDIRAFADRRCAIESEAFIRPSAASGSLLGLGPFVARDIHVSEAGWAGIEDIAAGIDAWLRSDATRIPAFWDRVCDSAAGRTIVLYGLGRNGRALLRACPKVPDDLAVCDDYADDPSQADARHVPVDRLDPRVHYICVTPDRADDIGRRLRARGFASPGDWSTMRVLCREAHEAATGQREVEGGHGTRACGEEARICVNALHTRPTSA